jgi:exopolyphosphatase/guanosine-5'-triphosphate,3'-diphosphate pyrophosphatase
MAIYSSGYSFRYREKPGKVTYTFKSLDSTCSPVSRREETEVSFPEKKTFEELEDGKLKQMLSRIAGSGRLFPLFEVAHRRKTSMINADSMEIVEISLDDVTVTCEGNRKSYLEVELELRGGTEEELDLLISAMREDFGLTPGSSCKFDNGMELLRENTLKDVEKANYGAISVKKESKPLPLKEMFEEYDVERAHARKVAENALELFDSLAPVHGLGPHLRTVMRIAALVHDVGFTTDMKDHHKEGRNILMTHPPAELPFPLHMMLPWTTFLHKKRIDGAKLEKLKTRKEFAAMPAQMQHDTLKMAAILRIADGLDYSRMDSRITAIDLQQDRAVIELKGPGTRTDADRADTKCDMWRLLFKTDLQFGPAMQEQNQEG